MAKSSGGFDHVDAWVFDLDNTLYPSECDLFAQIDIRMSEFVARFLDVDLQEARRIQKQYYYDHGTTLSGLMKLHGLTPDEFLDYVHDIDLSPVPPNPQLNSELDELPGRKVVFTNGSKTHAENVLSHLNITHHFDAIIDIAASSFIPKPQPEAFQLFLDQAALDPTRAAMFDDLHSNLVEAKNLGMTTVWLKTHRDWSNGRHPDGGDTPSHVDHATDDLTVFLGQLNGRRPGYRSR